LETSYKIAEELGQELRAHSYRMATAESCTGGLVASTLTDIPGSSFWYEGGVVAYSNQIKKHLLKVPAPLLHDHGAVSQACVLAMVHAVTSLFQVSVALAVSGIAGPSGGSVAKPVGTVWIAWSLNGQLWSKKFLFTGDRLSVKNQSVQASLGQLLNAIKNGAPK
jgi:nicotinamide-nucleotide amidase